MHMEQLLHSSCALSQKASFINYLSPFSFPQEEVNNQDESADIIPFSVVKKEGMSKITRPKFHPQLKNTSLRSID